MLSELSSSEATFDNFLLRNLSAYGFLSLKANIIYSSSSSPIAKYYLFFHNHIFFIIIYIYEYKSQHLSRKFFRTQTNRSSYLYIINYHKAKNIGLYILATLEWLKIFKIKRCIVKKDKKHDYWQ